ncbi:molybdopterin-synthase adenylyltransferase MoeB [Geothrix sp. PMB-07]|uniref:molybdopterin-synthase adenylyltransferase MoeB n=1 Tax=Geothrix sp. PMB-07 TaxID=3068640 RepID=UPI002741313B|nr:molybdopterin-synthase adenylyltransferase MoeB [Geothrix sp. PMB-07]WLT33483.1 molybdopterin-synthase adenylyltransferase MoeB [Geothrix sp. PMB-07]
MAVSILIPTPLRRYVDGAKRVQVEASTAQEAIAALAALSPDLASQLLDEQGALRSFVNLYLEDQNVRVLAPSLQEVSLKDGDVLTIVPAIAGGAPEVRFSREEILRYSRHLIMPEVTLEGQKRLKGAKVLCIGAGGLGSPLALYLAAAGVGTIGLVDFDTLDLTNLQRQVLYSTADVGRPKLDAAKERLTDLNPEIEVVTHSLQLASWNALELFEGYDIIADGTDNFPTRYLVNDACVLSGKPNVYASIFRFEGQVSVFDASRGPCYRCLFPEPPPPGLVPSCAEGGVLGVLPGIIGSLQALEVLKLILGVGEPLVGRLSWFDALDFQFRELSVRKDPHCAVCGPSPSITALVDYEAFCQVRGAEPEGDGQGIPTVTVEEFHARRQSGETLALLDVREDHEAQIVGIPGAIRYPLSQLPARLHELDSANSYTLHCHRSGRSLEAYRLLRKAGFGHLQVLAGGVDAWAERIDHSLPRY